MHNTDDEWVVVKNELDYDDEQSACYYEKVDENSLDEKIKDDQSDDTSLDDQSDDNSLHEDEQALFEDCSDVLEPHNTYDNCSNEQQYHKDTLATNCDVSVWDINEFLSTKMTQDEIDEYIEHHTVIFCQLIRNFVNTTFFSVSICISDDIVHPLISEYLKYRYRTNYTDKDFLKILFDNIRSRFPVYHIHLTINHSIPCVMNIEIFNKRQ